MSTEHAAVRERAGTTEDDGTGHARGDAADRAREVHERQRRYVLASLLAVGHTDDERPPGA
jgi:hypothetical protein